MPINAGKIVAYLELDTSAYTRGFASARNDLKVFIDRSATAEQKIKGLTSVMSTTGSLLTKGLTVPILGVGTAAVKTAADFEAAMSQVKAISGATGSDFAALEQKAIDLGASTTFSATEVANAMTEMAKAGWDSQQILDGMQGVLNAASASGEELATVSTIVADSITTFGLAASESTRVADLLSQSANAGTISVSDLGESIKYIGPVAKTMGFEIEDVVTAITALSTAGIKGSQAGTALRTMFARLADPTKEVKGAMEELGIVIADSEGNFKDMDTILAEMRKKFQTLTPDMQAYYASVLAGQEGMSGLTALLGMAQEEYDNIAKSMENATGTAERTAAVMQDNLSGAIEQFGGALESAGIVIGRRLTPYIRKAADGLTQLTEKISNMSDEQLDSIVNFASMAAAMGPVLLISSKLLRGLTTLGRGFVSVTSNVSLFIQAIGLAKNGMTDVAMKVSPLYRGLISITSAINPMTVGIAAGGVALTALGVAVYNAHKEMEEYREQLRAETEEQKALTDAVNEQTQAREQSVENINKSVEGALSEAAAQEELARKLQSVVDENGKVIEGKETYAKFIAGELSEALGIEIGITDGQITNYGDLTNEIYDTIEAKKQLAIQEALSEDYTEALKNQVDARKQYNDTIYERIGLESELAAAEEELRAAQEAVTESAEKNGTASYEVSKQYSDAVEKVNALNDKLADNSTQLNSATENYEHWNQVVENYEGYSAALIEGDADKINTALLKIQEGFLTSNTATKESLEEQKTTLEEKYAEMQHALEMGYEGVTQDMVDQMGELVKQADTELQKELEQTKSNLTTAFKNMGIEVPEGMIDALASKSTDVQNQVTALFKTMESGSQLGKDQLVTLFTGIGLDIPEALISQLALLEPSVQEQAVSLIAQLQYGEQSKRADVLKQMRELGIQADDSVANGISSNTDKVKDFAAKVGTAGNTAMKNALQKKITTPKVSDGTTNSARSVAEAARSSMQSVFDRNPIVARVKAVTSGVSAGIQSIVNGSHADGLAYVPFDGYIAELHKGERILTEDENRSYSSGGNASGGDVFNFYNTQPNPYEYYRQMKRAKRELQYGV